MNILFIQYGDYREAFNSLNSGGEEAYKAQKHSVDYVAALQEIQGTEACVLCVNARSAYDEILPNGMRVVGLVKQGISNNAICKILDNFSPTHIVLRTPIAFVIEYSLNKQINVLPLFADYFSNRGLRSWYVNQKLVRLLNKPAMPIVSNHNLPACESLARLGVNRNKIVPWDWPASSSPDDFPIKSIDSQDVRLLYVGAVSDAKGCFDCIQAMDQLDYSQRNYTLRLIGPGELEKAKELASHLAKPEKVDIVGSIPNSKVIEEMAAADIVIVPSRHQYPEGMPNTIYESLVTRTPLIVSDHPVFTARFEDNSDVVFFKASQATSLAEKIEYLVKDSGLYQALSINSKPLWLKLQMPLKWDELISAWLKGNSAQTQLLSKFAIDMTRDE
jgi:glycosyltransferase involved in cell wall biosynthesis